MPEPTFRVAPITVPRLPQDVWELTATGLARSTAPALARVESGGRAIVTRRGLPVAVLVGVEELLALIVREQVDGVPTEREAFAELVGDELERRSFRKLASACAHGRPVPRFRARGLTGAERTRRRVQGLNR